MRTLWPMRENGDAYEDYAYNLSRGYGWWVRLDHGVKINSLYIAPGTTDEDVWLDYKVYFEGKRPGINRWLCLS